jgi:hypothetical protein
MDNSLLAQIIFSNENAFRDINDANKCHMIAGVCKVAKENEHLINAIDKNRVELYANRIFNYLLNHIYNSNRTKGDADTIDNEFSMNFADSISTMLNKQKLCYRKSFAEFILLDYIKILNHNIIYNSGYRSGYYDPRFISKILTYNYKRIIVKILGIDFEIELNSLKLRKIEENKKTYKKVEYMLWNIEDILELHNSIKCE